jgi:hypothetical protein
MRIQKKLPQNTSGFGLVEIAVAIGIVTTVLFVTAQASQLAHRVMVKNARETQAQFLLEEGAEIMKILRDTGWTAHIAPFISGTLYYPVFDATTHSWRGTLDNPGQIQGIFTRTVKVETVYRRNSDDDIVDFSSPDPKTLDAGTRKTTIRVSLSEAGTNAIREVVTYISDLHQN